MGSLLSNIPAGARKDLWIPPFVLPAAWSGSVCFSPEEREECAPSTAAARAPGLLWSSAVAPLKNPRAQVNRAFSSGSCCHSRFSHSSLWHLVLKIGFHKAFLCSWIAHTLFFKRVSVWSLARGAACLCPALTWSDCNTKLKVRFRTNALILGLNSSFRSLAASANYSLCLRRWCCIINFWYNLCFGGSD